MAALIALCLVTAACGGGAAEEDQPADQAGQAAGTTTEQETAADTPAQESEQQPVEAPQDGPLTKFDPAIDVTVMAPWDPNTTIKDGQTTESNLWLDAYADELGIRVTYPAIIEQREYANRINLTIASGDLPDMFRVNGTQLKQLTDAGQIEDVTDVYDRYASELTKRIMTEGGVPALASATFGGKLMGIPSTNSAVGSTPVLWVRTDWLKAVNLPEPQTMADVLAIAEAFAKQDPDGDNSNNTFGLVAEKGLFGGVPDLTGFFNSYHAFPNIWIKDDAGNIVYGSVQPEMKAALAELQRMYRDGIIDKEFGVKDGGKVSEDVTAGKLGMLYGQWWAPASPLQTLKNLDPAAEWKPFPYLSADGNPAKVGVGFPVSQYYVVKKGAAHPEALIKMLNLYLEKWLGEQPEPDYMVKPDGTQTHKFAAFIANPMTIDTRYYNVQEALKSGDTSKLTLEEQSYYDNILAYRAGDVSQWNSEAMYGDFSAVPIQGEYLDNGRIVINEFYGPPTETMAQKWDALRTMERETITNIILGSQSVDSFDNFVADWNSLGGEAITQEVNDTMKNK